MKIDYILPYVDNTDPVWQKTYDKFCKNNCLTKENKIRYSPNVLFKFVFRSIEKHMPWINNVHLIVQSKSQIPSWINQNNVNVVLHEDFIPSKFLPTFNSATIECFLHQIKKLSNFFIYGNDDTYVLNDVNEDDFFRNFMPLNSLVEHDCSHIATLEFYQKFFINVTHKALSEFDVQLKNNKTYLSPFHVQNSFSKQIIKSIFIENESMIYDSISQFREVKNLNQYFFIIKYLYKTAMINRYNSISHANVNVAENTLYARQLLLCSNRPKLICLNNNDNDNDIMLYSVLNKIFPTKSKYEN